MHRRNRRRRWGTALAQVAATGGRETLLWALEPEVVEAINAATKTACSCRRPARADGDPGDLRPRRACRLRRLAGGHACPAHALRARAGAATARRRWCCAPRASRKEAASCSTRSRARCCPEATGRGAVGTDFRPRSRSRPADRGDAGGGGSRARRAAAEPHRAPDIPHLRAPTMSPGPRSAGQSRTCSRSPAASSRASGLGQNARAALIGARFCRNDALRRSLGRSARNARRPIWARRPRAHLLFDQLAQFLAR